MDQTEIVEQEAPKVQKKPNRLFLILLICAVIVVVMSIRFSSASKPAPKKSVRFAEKDSFEPEEQYNLYREVNDFMSKQMKYVNVV